MNKKISEVYKRSEILNLIKCLKWLEKTCMKHFPHCDKQQQDYKMNDYNIKQPPIAACSISALLHKNNSNNNTKSAKSLQTIVSVKCNNNALFQLYSYASFLILLCLSISHSIPQSYAFNLENRLPIVKYGPHSDTYFGYSVATHTVGEYNWPNNTKWLLVGAPLDINLQPGTNKTGALYRCPITQNLNDCEQIITDGRRYQLFQLFSNIWQTNRSNGMRIEELL
ncbi:uncharacterized protein [Eurosta solidaginis]|uniref:uncharacterized protein n=1 Tax=Eurosta solidaginis TaxID=178769 RepID=UPI0035307394